MQAAGNCYVVVMRINMHVLERSIHPFYEFHTYWCTADLLARLSFNKILIGPQWNLKDPCDVSIIKSLITKIKRIATTNYIFWLNSCSSNL